LPFILDTAKHSMYHPVIRETFLTTFFGVIQTCV